MLHPAPVTKVAPTLTRGKVEEVREATATKPAFVILGFDNTNYRMWFRVEDADLAFLRGKVGKRVTGYASVDARKIANCVTGGRYVEPVYGAPQHVQGRIVEAGESAFVVDAGGPRLHVTPTHPDQPAGSFEVGQLVTFDAMEGATFTPAS